MLYFKTQGNSHYSCDISNKIMRIVKKCPDNEEKWREAAARMNCTIYANQCDEPERLVYHCVINTFVNQTLEVCAYAQNILQGFTKIFFFFFTSNYSIYLFLCILDVGHLSHFGDYCYLFLCNVVCSALTFENFHLVLRNY